MTAVNVISIKPNSLIEDQAPTIYFKSAFLTFCRSANEALYLSQLYYLQKRFGIGKSFHQDSKRIEAATGLSLNSQYRAKKHFIEIGVLTCKPKSVWFTLNMAKIRTLIERASTLKIKMGNAQNQDGNLNLADIKQSKTIEKTTENPSGEIRVKLADIELGLLTDLTVDEVVADCLKQPKKHMSLEYAWKRLLPKLGLVEFSTGLLKKEFKFFKQFHDYCSESHVNSMEAMLVVLTNWESFRLKMAKKYEYHVKEIPTVELFAFQKDKIVIFYMQSIAQKNAIDLGDDMYSIKTAKLIKKMPSKKTW